MLPVSQLHHPFPTIPNPTDFRSDKPDRQGSPFKNARFPRAATNGGGTIAKSEDGERCAVSGRECKFPFVLVRIHSLSCNAATFLEALRILKVTESEESEKRRGVSLGLRVEASRNFWEGSGLKIDSASTDVVWGHGGECFQLGPGKSSI